jgi:hypothetical protein
MTARTFQFYGQGWGPQTAEITVTSNGITVYSGPIPTVPAEPLVIPGVGTPTVLLFTSSILNVSDQGQFPVVITPTVGNMVIGKILANYVPIPNPIYTPEQYDIMTYPAKQDQIGKVYESLATPPFSTAEIAVLSDPATTEEERRAILVAHGVEYLPACMVSSGPDSFGAGFWPGDCKSQLAIDGILQPLPDPRPEYLFGNWDWIITTGQVLTFTFNVRAGLE